MTRIVLLAGWYYPDSSGGTEAYVSALARDLLHAGYEVQIAAPSADGLERQYAHDGIAVFRYPIDTRPSQDEVRGETPPRYLDRFAEWLASVAPHAVHSHSLTRGCGPAHLRVAAELGIPTLITVHTPHVLCARGTLMRWGQLACDGVYEAAKCTACLLHAQGMPRAAASQIARRSSNTAWGFLPTRVQSLLRSRALLEVRRTAVFDALDRAAAVVAVSRWLLDMLRLNGVSQSKLFLSPQGLTANITRRARRVRSNRGSRLRVGFIGRFDPVKGPDVLIRAVRALPRTVALELRLFGVAHGGEGQAYEARLRQLAADDDRIVFAGPVNDTNRDDVLAEIDILAVPSLWFETGPLVVLEAFAAGIPVVGSALGGIAERVTHGKSGWLVPTGDVDAWAKALTGLASRYEARDWAWDVPAVRRSQDVAVEMIALYRQVLGSSSTASQKTSSQQAGTLRIAPSLS